MDLLAPPAIEDEIEFRRVQHPSGGFVLVPVNRQAAAAVAPAADALPPDAVCRYTSKRCGAPRSLKRNGQLHNFCEFHRMKANENQRRLESKKKQQRQQQSTTGGSSSGSSNSGLPLVGAEDVGALPALIATDQHEDEPALAVDDLGCSWDDWERELELKLGDAERPSRGA